MRRLTLSANPESGAVTYTYDKVGNLQTKTDARGALTTNIYDPLDRIASKTYTGLSTATPAITYTYDSAANGVGLPASVSGSNVGTNFLGYDAWGHVTAHSQQVGSQVYPFSYSYNLAGALTAETYPSGRVVSSAYDGANRVSQVSGVLNGGSTNYALSIAYAPHGALAGWQFGNINPVSAGLNVWRGYGYNSRLQLTAVWDTVALNPSKYLFAEVLNWGTTNNNGNVLSSSVQASPPGALGAPPVFPASYTYDSVNRLQSAAEGTTWNQTYNHDAFGNMWESTSGLPANGTRPTANIYTTANRMNNATYDAAGNQTTVPNLPGASQAYDAENRIVTVTGSGTTTYAYDGDGHRVQKTASAGTTNYVYDAFGNLVAEYNSAAAPAAPCLTCYLSTDHLGSVRMITDQAGNVVSRHDYTPFGEEIPAGTGARTTLWGATDNVSLKFTGKERDTESGLDYFGARYYASNMGRWMSPDWADKPEAVPYSDLANPQSLNLYGYVNNNPLSKADADGHEGCCDALVNFAAGAFNAWGSDNLAGAGRVDQTTSAGMSGARFGDAVAAVQGVAETVQGVGAAIAGSAEAFVTAPLAGTGVGIVVPGAGAVVAVAGAAEAVHGVATAGTAVTALMKSGGNFSSGTKEGAKDAAGGKCQNCGAETTPGQKSQKGVTPPGNEGQTDHIQPKSKGGTNDPSNAQHLCRDCNRQKSDKVPNQ